MEFSITTIAQIAGGLIALLAAYGAKGDGFRATLSKLLPRSTQQKQKIANQDTAWRQLVDDSRDRDDLESVRLLNEWMQRRTEHGLSVSELKEK